MLSAFQNVLLPVSKKTSNKGDYTVPAITITCRNADGNALVSKVINNVKFETNKRTVLKGNLFPATSDGVVVDLNDTNWKADSIAVFY